LERKIKRDINCLLIVIVFLHIILDFMPLRIEPSELKRIASNGETHFVVSPFGTLVGWGNNEYNLVSLRRSSPIPVIRFIPYPYFMRRTILRNVTDVDTGRSGAMAVTKDGTLWGWGNFSNPNPDSKSLPYSPVKVMEDVVSVEVEHSSTYATSILKKNGELWIWGGVYGTTIPTAPLKIMENVKKIYGDSYNVFAINNNNDLYALSYSTGTITRPPTFIAAGVKDVKSAGSEVYMCLTIDGKVFIYEDDGYERKIFEPAKTPYNIVTDNVQAFCGAGIIKNDGSYWTWKTSKEGERILVKQNENAIDVLNYAITITNDGKIYAKPILDSLPLIPQSMWTVSPVLRNLFILGLFLRKIVNIYYKKMKDKRAV